jgi:hypothetical protein
MLLPNIKFYKIRLLKEFLQHTSQSRDKLFEELVNNATDPVIYKRRFRMLQHLDQYESQIIKKIYDFETDDPNDLTPDLLLGGLKQVLNRSA